MESERLDRLTRNWTIATWRRRLIRRSTLVGLTGVALFSMTGCGGNEREFTASCTKGADGSAAKAAKQWCICIETTLKNRGYGDSDFHRIVQQFESSGSGPYTTFADDSDTSAWSNAIMNCGL